jgi:SAM-dependent methyltransferase
MKSETDQHWNQRAASVEKDHEVNIMDVFQRELEYGYVCRHLTRDMRLLEVGCGNGFSTNRFRPFVRHVDAFDFSDEMIVRAKATYGETTNRFLHDDVLDLKQIIGTYDAVICVRVLINLRDLNEQRTAVRNMKTHVAPGGLLILVEGYTEGFNALSRLRGEIGLPPIRPAPINFYSSLDDVLPEFEPDFHVEERFHLGAYDYLTRVVYPLVAGHENVTHNSAFAERCSKLAQQHNPDCLEELSRVRGLVFRRTR